MKKTILSILFTLFTIVNFAQLTKTIGPLTGANSANYGPFIQLSANSLLTSSANCYLYTASELDIPTGSTITKLEWLKISSVGTTGEFKVYLKNTSVETISTSTFGSVLSGSTLVYSNPSLVVPTQANGWISCAVPSFVYGGNTLQLTTNWNRTTPSLGAIKFHRINAAGKSVGIASATPLTSATNLVGPNYGNLRPTLRITYSLPDTSCDFKAGTIVGPAHACQFETVNLSLTSTPVSGVTYTWMSSYDSLNFGVADYGDNINVQWAEPFYYQCVASCGGKSDTTPVFRLTVSPIYDCFGISKAISPADEDIVKVSLNNITNVSSCTTGDHLYTNYQNLPPIKIEKGKAIPYVIGIKTCLNDYLNFATIFIDYDQSGAFEADEQVVKTLTPKLGDNEVVGTITIPAEALHGVTKMRVIVSEQNNPITSPYGYYSFGETEDYLVNILEGSLCSNPTPGATKATDTLVCKGTPVTVSLENLIEGGNVEYQWFKHNTPLAGATSLQYTGVINDTAFFYCRVICMTDTVYSTPVVIGMKPFYDCYCTSIAMNDADVDMQFIQIGEYFKDTECPTESVIGSLEGRYSKTEGIALFVQKGSFVDFDVELDDCDGSPFYSSGFAMWIDFDHDGFFSLDEKVYSESNAPVLNPRHVISTIEIPLNALSGVTGMRLIVADGINGVNLNSCSMYSSGETEDFLIEITE
jgi:hypothetical protein